MIADTTLQFELIITDKEAATCVFHHASTSQYRVELSNSLSLGKQLSSIPFNEMTNSNAIVTNSLTYENPIYGISIDYPSNWAYQEAQEDTLANTTIFSIVNIAPPISEDPNVVTNFQIGIEDLKSPTRPVCKNSN